MNVNVNANNSGLQPEMTTVGAAPLMAETAPVAGGKNTEPAPILPNPSVTVTEKSVTEQLIEDSFDSAMNTAKNLVDSPEERARKAENRERAERKQEISDRAEARYAATETAREIASVRLTQTGGTLDIIDA